MNNQNQPKILNKGISTPKGIIIIVLFALLAGGIIAWQYGLLEKEGARAPEVKVVEKVIEDGTADWKTYKNEEYGYEVKYPKDWYTYGLSYSGVWMEMISTFSPEQYDKYYVTIEEKEGKLGENYGYIQIYQIGEYSLLEESFEKMKEGWGGWLRTRPEFTDFITEEVNTEAVKGYKLYLKEEHSESYYYQEVINIVYLLSDKDEKKAVRLEGLFKAKDKEKGIYEKYAEIFNQMLSTFRFLE